MATTIDVTTDEAIRRWLVDGVDFTHIIQSGDLGIEGSYFDVLLLSKILGLRSDRKVRAGE
ncbi:hypothetical protein Rhow_006080 [Rhodococcus wratislaviensis]|uniref:Uncharacterized protein n=1 Tax=Rhodococcus wratislaviensis TaxID=44752 RepID=A0A402CEU1_RHOWR|nr:hypothetical protein [Rhodococcus wratislaviensis]GCE42141.1 hypothetical protein Rhow_006080 [Rhodococcus wratislaviensis]